MTSKEFSQLKVNSSLDFRNKFTKMITKTLNNNNNNNNNNDPQSQINIINFVKSSIDGLILSQIDNNNDNNNDNDNGDNDNDNDNGDNDDDNLSKIFISLFELIFESKNKNVQNSAKDSLLHILYFLFLQFEVYF